MAATTHRTTQFHAYLVRAYYAGDPCPTPFFVDAKNRKDAERRAAEGSPQAVRFVLEVVQS
jgi:hypothetical protein